MKPPTASSSSMLSPSRRTNAAVVTEIEDYVKAKDIDQLFKKILTRCFRVRPDDPIAFVFDYLMEHYPQVAASKGFNITGDAISVVVTHSDHAVATYLNEHLSVASLFETIAEKLAEDRPEKPLQHVVDLLSLAAAGDDDDDDVSMRRGSNTSTENSFGELDDQVPVPSFRGTARFTSQFEEEKEDEEGGNFNDNTGEEDEVVGEIRVRLMSRDPSGINLVRRPSVSAECVNMSENGDITGPNGVKRSIRGGDEGGGGGGVGEATATSVAQLPKTDAEKASILGHVRDSLLFKDIEQRLLDELVDAVFPVTIAPNHVIIKQGDEGENFYLLAEGEAEAHVRGKVVGEPPTKVQHLTPGMSFGELSLMYNNPRAATITSVTDVKLWALDRRTFRRIVSLATQRARYMHEGFLERVPILSSLTAAERGRLADAIETKTFALGESVVTQGEDGDAFYIVEEGQAAARIYFEASSLDGSHEQQQQQQQQQKGQSSAEVKRYSPGDYFGELALITDKPRAATVVAASERLVCVSVSKASFRRLMGSCETIMRRNIESYKQIMMELAVSGVGGHYF